MDLNNYIQNTYGRQHVVTYGLTRDGLVHDCTWTAIAYGVPSSFFTVLSKANYDHCAIVDGVEYGKGSGASKKAAKEEAAHLALGVVIEHGLPDEGATEVDEGEPPS
jgi:hypothetical protein